MDTSPYSLLAQLAAELEKQAIAGQWERMSMIVNEVLALLESGALPNATASDRPAIEATHARLVAINERAIPLREDLVRLLSAFGYTPPSG